MRLVLLETANLPRNDHLSDVVSTESVTIHCVRWIKIFEGSFHDKSSYSRTVYRYTGFIKFHFVLFDFETIFLHKLNLLVSYFYSFLTAAKALNNSVLVIRRQFPRNRVLVNEREVSDEHAMGSRVGQQNILYIIFMDPKKKQNQKRMYLYTCVYICI